MSDQRPPAGWFGAILGAIVLAPLALPLLWLMFAFVLGLFGVEPAAPAAWLTLAAYGWIISSAATRRHGCPIWPSEPPERRAGW